MGSRSNRFSLWLLIATLFAGISAALAQSPRHLSADLINLELLSDEDLVALESLLDNPVNLNRATPSELWFLDDSLVTVVLTARQSGPFGSWEDVARRTLLPPDRIRSLQQLAYLSPEEGVEARLSARLATAGADERIRTRFNLDGRRWAAQWMVQRDPGEYHLADLSDLSVTIRGNSTSLDLGAHRMTWGMGLVLADEFASPRGETLLRPISRIVHLRPGYSNTNTGVLRGASIHHSGNRFQFFAGTSFQRADITTDPDGTSRVVAYRAHTGTAVTAGEVLSYLAGTASLLGWDMGGLVTWHQLRTTSERSGLRRRVYSLVAFRSFQTRLGEWHLSHEEAFGPVADDNARQGYQRASQTRLSFVPRRGVRNDRLRLSFLYRSYPPDWIPLRGRLVGDRVSRGNESGLFFGWQWRHRPLNISGYLDSYRQAESQVSGYWPREGWESGLTVSARMRPLEAAVFYRYREETASAGSQNSDGLYITQQKLTASHYLKLTLAGFRLWNFTTRFMTAMKVSEGDDGQGSGMTLGGSLRYRFLSDLSLVIGAHGFTTDGWDQRLYVYEDGLPGEFNFRALSGRGVRVHGRMGLPVGRGLVSLRVARQWWRASPGGTALLENHQVALQMDIAL